MIWRYEDIPKQKKAKLVTIDNIDDNSLSQIYYDLTLDYKSDWEEVNKHIRNNWTWLKAILIPQKHIFKLFAYSNNDPNIFPDKDGDYWFRVLGSGQLFLTKEEYQALEKRL